MKLYDDAVLEAAASREAGDSVGAWRLADALLAQYPKGENHGGDRSKNGPESLLARLQVKADELSAENIQTPAGAPYSAHTLLEMRSVALAWDKDARHPQAAYRTHQEAGSPGSEADVALKALCKYAAGGAKRKPTEIDSTAWAGAIAMVDKLLTRKAKYAVSANALRAAVQRKNNTFTPAARVPEEPVTAKTAAATVRSLPTAERAELVKDLVTSDPESRKSAEAAVRQVHSDELAAAHEEFMEAHGGKRKSGLPGGPDDAPRHTVFEPTLASLGIFNETEGYKDSLLRIIKIISDKRELLTEEHIEYLRDWSTEVHKNLDVLDELLKLGTGLTDEAMETLLKGD